MNRPFHMDEIIKFEREHPAELNQIRNAVIEQCALVAESYHEDDYTPPVFIDKIAAAIRKLKERS